MPLDNEILAILITRQPPTQETLLIRLVRGGRGLNIMWVRHGAQIRFSKGIDSRTVPTDPVA